MDFDKKGILGFYAYGPQGDRRYVDSPSQYEGGREAASSSMLKFNVNGAARGKRGRDSRDTLFNEFCGSIGVTYK